jgi:hypothetical protein
MIDIYTNEINSLSDNYLQECKELKVYAGFRTFAIWCKHRSVLNLSEQWFFTAMQEKSNPLHFCINDINNSFYKHNKEL